jgi:hypothetical protein
VPEQGNVQVATSLELATIRAAPLATRRTRVVGWVLAPDGLATIDLTPIGVQHRTAAWTATLLGEQGRDRGGRVDLPTATVTGESWHGAQIRGIAARAAATRSSG